MNIEGRLQRLVDKDEIRDLALLYSRGVDRKDPDLLRTLYTLDGTDNHGHVFQGSAVDYVEFLVDSFQLIKIGAHYICNHLIDVDGDHATGEVYALGYHIIPGGVGDQIESLVGVRYVDRYRREGGRWRFAHREVLFDLDRSRPTDHRIATPEAPEDDTSYEVLGPGPFARVTPHPAAQTR